MDLPKMLLVITKGINMVDFPRPIVIIMLVYPRPFTHLPEKWQVSAKQ